MRRILVLSVMVGFAVISSGAARADLGGPTTRLIEKHTCGDVVDGGIAEVDCEKARRDVEFVKVLAHDAVCGDVVDGGIAEIDCEKARRDVEFVVGAAHLAACTEAGADLDCEGYRHDAERLERDVARAASRALKDAGL